MRSIVDRNVVMRCVTVVCRNRRQETNFVNSLYLLPDSTLVSIRPKGGNSLKMFLDNYVHSVASLNGRNKSARCISHVCCHVAVSTWSAKRKVLRGYSLPAISTLLVYRDFTSILKRTLLLRWVWHFTFTARRVLTFVVLEFWGKQNLSKNEFFFWGGGLF
jgi:hypothetical protein